MTYGFVMDVPGPIEFYDAVHAEVARRSGGRADGLILHLGRATGAGFQVLEIWETKEQSDRFNAEVTGRVMAELAGDQSPPGEPAVEEFEPRGLVVPSAAVMV